MPRITTTWMVQLTGCGGLDVNAHLCSDNKPTRQDQKLKSLSKYLQQHPTEWQKRWELADLLYEMGRWSEAVQEYDRVLARQPQLIEVQLQLGKILQMMGKSTEAIAFYKQAQTGTRNRATTEHLQGAIASCSQEDLEAATAFAAAAELEPENPAHWLALGQTQMSLESPVAAKAAFDAILQGNPDDIIALRYSADALMALGLWREAQQRLQQARQLYPEDFQVLKRVADWRCRRRLVEGPEGKQTKQLITTALKLSANAAGAAESLAYYYLFRGNWKKGVAVLQEFVEARPQNPCGWYYYARCLFHTGQNQAAAEAIDRALELHRPDCEIYRAACEILPQAGKLDRLQPLIEEMLSRFPSRWSIWTTAGLVLVESYQDLERGCQLAAKAPELQPQLGDAWCCYGRVLALAGKHQQGVEALSQGWQWLQSVGGYTLPAALWLAESYQVLGKLAQSESWWSQVQGQAKELMEFNPATANYWQGQAFQALGDEESAILAYRSALKQQLLYPARQKVESALSSWEGMV